MDGREVARMKSYYHALLELGRCVPFTSEIPSDEPILFYKLFLEGVWVEPYLGNDAYLALKAGDPAPVPIEDEEPEESDNDDEICVFGDAPPPKARAKGVPPAFPAEFLPIGPGEDEDPTDLDPRRDLRGAHAKAKSKTAAPKAKSKSAAAAPIPPKPKAALPLPPAPAPPPPPLGGSEDELFVPPPKPPSPHPAVPPR